MSITLFHKIYITEGKKYISIVAEYENCVITTQVRIESIILSETKTYVNLIGDNLRKQDEQL